MTIEQLQQDIETLMTLARKRSTGSGGYESNEAQELHDIAQRLAELRDEQIARDSVVGIETKTQAVLSTDGARLVISISKSVKEITMTAEQATGFAAGVSKAAALVAEHEALRAQADRPVEKMKTH